MRLHTFFVAEKIGEKNDISITDAGLAHQLKKVFRFKEGQEIVLFDNSGREYVSEISSLTTEAVGVRIKSAREHTFHPRREVTLIQSIVKKDTFEWIVQKSTELGVSTVVPVIAERSEKKSLNLDRLVVIAKEACEQSGRSVLPTIQTPVSLLDAISLVSTKVIAFHSGGETFDVEAREALPKAVSILIGPEGGWSDHELFLFREKGIAIFSLGSQTLRAETAAVVVSAILLL
ncbi:MAG: 16S rRNA (uracil(1498)-N(3))-methyltransferase [Patescibacteria group bacterium]